MHFLLFTTAKMNSSRISHPSTASHPYGDLQYRTMASSRCTAIAATIGQLQIPCPCERGLFSYPFDAQTPCNRCTHPLSGHEDASTDLQASFSSAGKFIRSSRALSIMFQPYGKEFIFLSMARVPHQLHSQISQHQLFLGQNW